LTHPTPDTHGYLALAQMADGCLTLAVAQPDTGSGSGYLTVADGSGNLTVAAQITVDTTDDNKQTTINS
jgi:hypothetical protein